MSVELLLIAARYLDSQQNAAVDNGQLIHSVNSLVTVIIISNIITWMAFFCGAGATIWRRTCDRECSGSTHGRAMLRNNLGQVVHTLALVIGIWYWCKNRECDETEGYGTDVVYTIRR